MRLLCLLIFSVLSMAFCFGLLYQKAQLNDRSISEFPAETQPHGYFVFEIADLKFDPVVDAAINSGTILGDKNRFQPSAYDSHQMINYPEGSNHPERLVEKWDQHLETELSKKPILKITKYQLL